MKGVIKTLNRGKFFGFIRDENGDERFFHANNLDGVISSDDRVRLFSAMTEGQRVEFVDIRGEKGLRADHVKVVK